MTPPLARRVRAWLLRVASLAGLGRGDAETAEEIEVHHRLLADEYVQRGLLPDEAWRRAAAELGSATSAAAAYRDRRGLPALDDVVRDGRMAIRSFARTPMLSLIMVLVLGLGIGVSTAMFSIVDAVLVKPVGDLGDEDRLVLVGEESLQAAAPAGTFSPTAAPPVFLEWRAANTAFVHLEAAGRYPGDELFAGRDRSELLKSQRASAGFFATLGIKPLYGRSFRPEEEHEGAGRVTIVTHQFWRSRLGQDPGVLSTTIRLNGEPHTIVGILPANRMLDGGAADIWLPLAMAADEIDPRNFWLLVHGRLKPDVTMRQAEADLNRIEAALKQDGQVVDKENVVRVRPYRDHVVGQDMRRFTLLLSGAVAFVLLIACTNLAHLLVARYARTRKDVAIRVALGASRSQIVRQFLIEGLVLCTVGGAFGLLAAVGIVRGLLHLMPPALFIQDVHVALDVRVLAFTAALSMLTGIGFGLLPVLTFARTDLRTAGMNMWGSSTIVSRPMATLALLVGEVALTFTLVSGSLLLLGSLVRLLAIDPGFRTSQTVALHVKLDPTRYTSLPRVLTYQDAMLAQILALPGVASAAVSNALPLTGRNSSSGVSLAGVPGSRIGAGQRFVSDGYFAAMAMPVLRGRPFAATDVAGATRVAVINETYARVLERYRDPLGAELLFQGDPVVVVGIVGDVRHWGLTSNVQNEIYTPLLQARAHPSLLSQLAFIVQTTGDPAPVMSAVNRIAAMTDRDVAVASLRTMDDYLTTSVAQPRFISALFGLFGTLALGLTAAGLYGVLSSFVSQRTREFGIRLALGAQRRDIANAVLLHGIVVTTVGIALGLVGAVLLGRALSGLLFGVSATEPTLYAGAATVLAVVALLACWLPARRATTADPLVVLRSD